MQESGAGGETRTPNRPITNRVLYQLSHTSAALRFTRVLASVNSFDRLFKNLRFVCLADSSARPPPFCRPLAIWWRRLAVGRLDHRGKLLYWCVSGVIKHILKDAILRQGRESSLCWHFDPVRSLRAKQNTDDGNIGADKSTERRKTG